MNLSIARGLLCILVFSAFFTPAAKAAPIKGKLIVESPEGYRVVAVDENAGARIARIQTNGKFSLQVKKNSSLHIIGPSGKYLGPLGAARGKKFYPSLTGKKGNLGRIAVGQAFGRSKLGGKTRKLFGRRNVAFDPESGPLGAGNFGLVLSPVEENLRRLPVEEGGRLLGGDFDRDGIPDLLDIDDDGDLELDVVDPVQHQLGDFNAEIASTLRLDLSNSLNVNVGSITEAQTDALIRDNLFLLFLLQSFSTDSVTSVNVDCGALSYCSSTGTAVIQMDSPPIPNGSSWSQYDPEGDGLPNLFIRENRMPEINIHPRATRSEIGTGDTILFKITTSEGERVFPAVLPFVFATVPALHSYRSAGGLAQEISYPVNSESGSGTRNNPLSLPSGSVSLSFWKPQRSAIGGAEPDGFIDMGGLNYGVYLSPQNGTQASPLTCSAAEFTNPTGGLQALSGGSGAQLLVDTSKDAPSNRENVLGFTLDLASCLSRQGVSTSGLTVMMDLVATSQAQDQTSQSVYFRLP